MLVCRGVVLLCGCVRVLLLCWFGVLLCVVVAFALLVCCGAGSLFCWFDVLVCCVVVVGV